MNRNRNEHFEKRKRVPVRLTIMLLATMGGGMNACTPVASMHLPPEYVAVVNHTNRGAEEGQASRIDVRAKVGAELGRL